MKPENIIDQPITPPPPEPWPTKKRLTTMALLWLATAVSPGAAPNYSFQEIIIPGATLVDVFGINNAGTLVGSYYGDAVGAHGFILSNGAIENFQIPGARFTNPYGINNSGQVVGSYRDQRFNEHPFLRNGDGSVVLDQWQEGGAAGINDVGTIVGSSRDVGAILDAGNVTFFTYPFAGNNITYLTAINASGAFVGGLVLEDTFPTPGEYDVQQVLGFIVDTDGPRLLPTPSRFAAAAGINASGTVVGSYVLVGTNSAGTDEVWAQHGFVQDGAGLHTVDVPGSFDWPLTLTVDDPDLGLVELQRVNAGTSLLAVNDRGQIVAESLASYQNFGGSVVQDLSRSYVGTPRPTFQGFNRLADGQFRLQFEGATGLSHTVLASTNLIDWLPLGPATETAPGQFEFTDADAPNHTRRFYQVRTP